MLTRIASSSAHEGLPAVPAGHIQSDTRRRFPICVRPRCRGMPTMLSRLSARSSSQTKRGRDFAATGAADFDDGVTLWPRLGFGCLGCTRTAASPTNRSSKQQLLTSPADGLCGSPIDRPVYPLQTVTRRESSGETLEILRRHGAPEQIALVVELSMSRQERILLFRFDAFGDD